MLTDKIIDIIITDNEKDFTKLEKNEHSFFRAINSFPEITGIPLESNKPGEKYDGNIFLKSINEFHLDKPTWEKHHNLSLNKNDLVIVYFNSSERNFSTMNMNLGTYTGFKKIDSETEQTYYEIKIGDNTMLLPRGINCIGAHFITQQEFLITANNAKDAIHKTSQLFEKFNLARHKLDNIETSKKHN